MHQRVQYPESIEPLVQFIETTPPSEIIDRTLEKLLSRQKDSGVSISAPVLEINPSHVLMKALSNAVKTKGASSVDDAAHLLLDQAFVLEGEQVTDPATFAKRLDAMMAKAFG